MNSTTHGPEHVGEDLAGQDVRRPLVAEPGRLDVVELALGEHRGADGAGDDRGEDDPDHDDRRVSCDGPERDEREQRR